MEAPQKRCRKSVVWEHFHLETPNKVRCMYCDRQLAYFNNTSSMMRHLRSTHPAILQCAEDGNFPPVPRPATDTAGPSKQGRQRELDEALVDMVVKDLQPFTIVEDEGFMAFVNKLDPSYVLPSRKALKTMVTERYNISKEKTMEDLKKADFVSLTADMWSSINMDGYLGVTCHYITPEAKLATVVLGVRRFYQTHTAQHLMEAKALLMAEWGITTKVQCMVTDNASNMILSAQLLNLRHVPCFAHNLNLIVKKALDQTPLINEIRQKARKIVGLFRSSCKAKDKLVEMQGLMGRPALKLMQEVDTRWNSTYDMLQRLYEQREPVGAALSNLNSDTAPLTSFEYNIIQESLSLLQPFKLATTELSEEQRVSASKLISLYRMLQHKLSQKKGQSAQESTAQLGTHLQEGLHSRCGGYESFRALALATLLDPRFKNVGFGNPAKAQEAEKQITLECASLMRSNTATPEPQSTSGPSSSSSSTTTSTTETQDSLWELFDSRIHETQATHSVTVEMGVGKVSKPRNKYGTLLQLFQCFMKPRSAHH
ncbi:zinc finger BED domain-containing protein 4-like [Carassius gibelio]|uniref:zinc finger BED domain-containing protein 4-like n=1 Tax=Carassius gibelio TaxID=101364 RepID=UPI002279CFBD|nr:zinc finger BED domain-containing protein 4-like [Carassius gibelio]